MFGWLVNKNNEVKGYYHVTVKNDKIKTDMKMEYPISWFREDINPKMKKRYAEKLREFRIIDAKFRGLKESLPKKMIRKWIDETNKLSWEELIAEEIKSKYEQLEIDLISRLAEKGYELHKCKDAVGGSEYFITDMNNVIVGGNGNQNMSLEEVEAWVNE